MELKEILAISGQPGLYKYVAQSTRGVIVPRLYAHTGGKEAVSPKEAPEKLRAFFAEVLPEYDRDRVHVSDMKKCFAWFNILIGAGFTEFRLPAEEE